MGRALLVAGALDGASGASTEEIRSLHLFRLPLDGATAGGFTEIAVANRPLLSSSASNYPMASDPVEDRLFVQIDKSLGGVPSEIWSLPLAACR